MNCHRSVVVFRCNNIYNQIIKLRSDNGGEYVNNKFTTFYIEQGIQQQHTVPYTPQQNGVAERKNRTLKKWLIV